MKQLVGNDVYICIKKVVRGIFGEYEGERLYVKRIGG